MEFFHGYFEESTLEDKLGCHFVKVEGKLYKFWHSDLDINPYGYSLIFHPEDRPQLMCYWYNGGAGIHEVVEEAIKRYVNGGK